MQASNSRPVRGCREQGDRDNDGRDARWHTRIVRPGHVGHREAVSALAPAIGATVSASGNAGAVAVEEAFAAGLASVMGFAVAFVLHQIAQ